MTYLLLDDVQPRYEIRDLQAKYPKQFTLFILALEKIKEPGYKYTGSDAPSWQQLGTSILFLLNTHLLSRRSGYPRQTLPEVEVSDEGTGPVVHLFADKETSGDPNGDPGPVNPGDSQQWEGEHGRRLCTLI
jgi:hypothetical protein